MSKFELHHTTIVAIDNAGIALSGPSGAGKSDLALRLIDRGAKLVGDDYVHIFEKENCIAAKPAPNIAGKIEIYGLGIFTLPYVEEIAIRLWINLAPIEERMPLELQSHAVCGYEIPYMVIDPNWPSAPIKVEYALQSVVDQDLWPVPKVV